MNDAPGWHLLFPDADDVPASLARHVASIGHVAGIVIGGK
jgi:hypothetical protein